MKKYLFISAGIHLLFLLHVHGQNNLDALMNQLDKPQKTFVTGTFKGTRVINLQSVEKTGPKNLQFIIQHRFGAFNGGGYQLFGLDQATIRFGLEYGISRFLSVGIGRSSFEKTYDAYGKMTLIRQSTGPNSFPLTIAYFGSGALKTLKWTDTTVKNYFSSRISFTHQLILASKFSDRFSIEIVPTYIHKNLVIAANDPNDFYAVGAGARLKLTKRTSLNAEYIYRVPPKDKSAPASENFYNSFSVGFDIETGGHVFQFHLTNSLSMLEKGFITETGETWQNGGIHLGFNISRDFSFGKKKR
jgi:hypothetical protein